MSKLMLVEQPFGIGDIIFTQSLVNDFIHEGYDIIWPVANHTVTWLLLAYPKIQFIPESLIRPESIQVQADCEKDGMRVLPIRYAEYLMGRPYKMHMVSKYELYGKNWRAWSIYGMPQRNITRENELKKELGITNGMKYNFVQTKFGNKGQHRIHISPTNDYPNIEMRHNDGYSFFDYCGVIEGAEQIHSVSSGTLYLYELLDLKAKEIHIFNRTPVEKNLDFVRFIFTKDYILHE